MSRTGRLPLDAPATGNHELMLFPLRGENWQTPRPLGQLRFPDGTNLAGVFRDGRCLPPKRELEVASGDLIAMFAPPDELPELGKALSGRHVPEYLAERAFFGDFVLNGDALLGDVEQVYGIEFNALSPDITLAECFSISTKGHPVVGDTVVLGPVTLVARATEADRVTKVGLRMDGPQNR